MRSVPPGRPSAAARPAGGLYGRIRRVVPPHVGEAVLRIALLCIAVEIVLFAGVYWFAPTFFGPLWRDWLAVSWPNLAHGHVWTVLTYGFVHDLNSPLHLVFNLVFLYFLGPPMEERWGTRGFVHFFLVAVIVGGLFTVVAQLVGFGLGPTVGASAGCMGLLAAWSWLYPNRQILLMFIIPVRARWILPLSIGLDLLFAFTGSDTAVAAHIGGVAGAWLVLHGWTRPRLLRTRWNVWRATRAQAKARSKFRVIPGGKRDEPDDWVN